MRRGFKTQAQGLALEVRAELEIGPHDVFDPRALANLYGIPVYGLEDLEGWGINEGALGHFNDASPGAFSAALIPVGSAKIIVENTAHATVRRRANIAHEMSHVVLEHDFRHMVLFADGCRVLDTAIEDEATWFAGELLIPTKAALRAARAKLTDVQVADAFEVSTKLAAMRMNVSGARKRALRETAARRRRTVG